MPFVIDLTNETAATIDTGGLAEPGWHIAEIEDIYPEEESGADVFKFKITHGRSTNCRVFDRLYNPEFATDEQKAVNTVKKIKIFGTRLGVVKSEDFGKPGVEIDFTRCIGKEVVIQVQHDEYPHGSGKIQVKMPFSGVYGLDSDKIPVAVRVALGLPLLQGQSEAPQGKPSRGAKKGTDKGTSGNGPASSPSAALDRSASGSAPPIDVSNL